jgi:hypothetical protein
MSRAWIGGLLGVIIAATFGAARLPACSCSESPRASNCASLKPFGPSFVGTVIDIENPPNEQRGADQSGLSRYRFRIDENINGFDEKEVDIYSARGGGDCSYHFRMSESYFVAPVVGTAGLMAMYGAKPGALMAIICSATQPKSTATALLTELRARKRTGAAIVGVLRTEPGPDDFDHRIPDATVELRTATTVLSTQTDIGGVYQFYGVPSATYQVALKLPKDFQAAKNKSTVLPSITVADQPCYAKDIYAAQPVPTGNP